MFADRQVRLLETTLNSNQRCLKVIDKFRFKQSAHISSYILETKLHEQYPEKDRHLLQALNCAMIVAYVRPFSSNEGSSIMLPGLPQKFLKLLTLEERDLHKIVMKDRNEVLAHSDSAAYNLRFSVMRSPGRATLVPLHHDTTAPLKEDPTRLLNGMALKLMKGVFEERILLEKDLLDLFPTLNTEDGSISGDELAMYYGGWQES